MERVRVIFYFDNPKIFQLSEAKVKGSKIIYIFGSLVIMYGS
jgi:hypothetical protein